MPKTREEQIEAILETVSLIHRTVSSDYSKENYFRSKGSITLSQWTALLIIAREGSMSLTELAKKLSVTASAATQLVNELVINGYITREEKKDDRRVQSLSLSTKTEQEMGKMRSKHTDRFIHMFDGLSLEELEHYAKLNKKISDHLIEAKLQ